LALDVFSDDVVECHKAAQVSRSALAKRFPENSLLSILLSGGNDELYVLGMLRRPGLGREIVSLTIRRVYSAILDSGTACSNRHQTALLDLLRRVFAVSVLQFLALILLRRRFGKRIKK